MIKKLNSRNKSSLQVLQRTQSSLKGGKMNNIVKSKWYEVLAEDCKNIITEETRAIYLGKIPLSTSFQKRLSRCKNPKGFLFTIGIPKQVILSVEKSHIKPKKNLLKTLAKVFEADCNMEDKDFHTALLEALQKLYKEEVSLL